MNQHFLQSIAWEKFQQSLGRQTFRQAGNGWEFMAILERGTGNSRLYCPYGPTAKNEESLHLAIDSLIELAKKYHVTFLRIEPTNPDFAEYLKSHHWKKVTYQQLQPEHTNVIDLTKSTDQLMSNMSASNRNLYRNYAKKGLKIHHSANPDDVKIFLQLIHKVAARTGMRPHNDNYFQRQSETLFPLGAASLFYVTYQNTPITATIVYDSPSIRYYAHTGTDSNFVKQRGGNVLVAHMLFDAKERGLKLFDLYGVAPEDSPANHPWAGFSKFKRSFGGSDVTFGGAWDLPMKPISYQLYRTYQSLR